MLDQTSGWETMKITVVLCTYNRCRSLSEALTSLAASMLPDSVSWEVLVVDNNSNDQTRDVVEEFCNRYPGHFRYLLESRPGKTFALNAGIGESQSDILAFTDDDVTVDPAWLQNLTAALHGSDWAGSSGRTLPGGHFAPPRWVPLGRPYILAPLALFDPGPQARQLDEAPFGNNMAYRREVFEKYGSFRTDLGPRAASKEPQKSEDIEFGNRLLAAGERFWYEPSAVLYHSIPLERLQRQYFLNWWFDKSRSDIRAFGIPPGAKWFIGGVPLYLFRRLAVWTLRWIIALEPSQRFDCKRKAWCMTAQIMECYRKSRESDSKRVCDART
jgi:glycosyltransferase involved in cell wall biosynthesis